MKKIIILIMALMVVGFVISADVSITNKDVPIDKVEYDKLNKVNSTVFITSPIRCNLEECDIINVKSSFANSDFVLLPYWINCTLELNTICLEKERVYYTDKELKEQVSLFVEEVKKRVLNRVDLKTAKETQDPKDEKVGSEKITYTTKLAPKP